MKQNLIQAISEKYKLGPADSLQISPLGEGLIHQTFLVSDGNQDWVLQGFNNSVFKFPDRISNNLGLLSKYILSHPLPFSLPLPMETMEGDNLLEVEGKLYRLFEFVKGQTIQQISKIEQAFLAAEAYGVFADWAKNVSIENFQESIPNFHRLDLRYDRLVEVAAQKSGQSAEEEEILQFYIGQKPLIKAYISLIEKIPSRLTHNDTKINNLIFSGDLTKVEAVIDLDTLMPGYLMYDFGDLVRTVACSLPETSTQWDQIRLQVPVFEALLKGYWKGIKSMATPEEINSLLLAGEIMTCIMGLRFFTDHIEGNVYYRVAYPEQNFHRAKNQMIFLKDQQSKRTELGEILHSLTRVV
ncbi:aminoglycoside phosphotransferase family protein [Algoriphagus sp. CAU 1675]|uniref:phosphotransferase enzyme family protein n=1 Tax=Algoriphagus sp. CAU 1675 TaxID=3032597 RepID=UPI0023DA81B9|nr:aminoglycoside phosphotransferase family protein [Algoriphagus sp. CAU 1675]MDF2156432.1 aminoglycoside phosphotransferase family protein [Algoriphagus sp. CAU 1675]